MDGIGISELQALSKSEEEHAALRDKRSAQNTLEQRRVLIDDLKEAMYKYKKPILEKIGKTQAALKKCDETNDSKGTEENQKKLNEYTEQLKMTGRSEKDVQEILARDKNLESDINEAIPSCGKDAESIRDKNLVLNKLREEVLEKVIDDRSSKSSTALSLLSYNTYLRAIKRVFPFSSAN